MWIVIEYNVLQLHCVEMDFFKIHFKYGIHENNYVQRLQLTSFDPDIFSKPCGHTNKEPFLLGSFHFMKVVSPASSHLQNNTFC